MLDTCSDKTSYLYVMLYQQQKIICHARSFSLNKFQNLITLPMKSRLLVNKISQGGTAAYVEFKICLRATNHEQIVTELELKEAEILSETTRYNTLHNSRRNNGLTLYERFVRIGFDSFD